MAVSAEPGRPDQSSAPAALAAIRRAVADVCTGAAGAIVTNPIAKNVLYRSGFAEPGHTEYLARLAKEATGVAAHPVMMLWSPELAVVPVTIHLPLQGRRRRRSPRDLMVETGRIVARDLRDALRHRASAPRRRRAQSACRRGRRARRRGPQRSCARRSSGSRRRASTRAARCPPTRCSIAAARASYDVALAMYHDQALIPIKTLAFDHAVNVTLGLPFVRTSPDHGTAFDIAGTGRADPASLIAALQLAARLAATAPGAGMSRSRA